MRRALVVSALVCGLLVGACDSGPKGPGQLTGRLRSGPIPVGAIVLEFTGAGITGFSGSGVTQAFFAENAPGVFRVVLVTTTAGEMDFKSASRTWRLRFPRSLRFRPSGRTMEPSPTSRASPSR